MTDRTVHADMHTLDGDFMEVVYYAKAGKWWSEATGYEADIERGRSAVPLTRTPLTASTAVQLCLMAHKSEQGTWYTGVPGGRTLDARVRKALGTKRSIL